ncbi:aldose 1-epimerase-like isoform X2 [Pseudomyrmex gracilis]|uniref:aldose 1-epimerase-like isoform X2 n=1 Tax=Pseudomyrmex gracilis TaxID=219809 RepID=UPI0009959EE8|nr:aldose 1-epimerase-like isoform X2 [Pseudomyrmex gracilis]
MSFETTLIEEDGFGRVPRPYSAALKKPYEIIRRYTLMNKNNATVRLISWGASIQSIRIPNREGKLADVVLGFDDMNGYLKNRYMGSIIGRVANPISANLKFHDATHLSSINDEIGKGYNGRTFDNVNWQSQIVNNQVVMSHLSRDNSEGYPGDMLTQVKYTWTDDNQLHINVRATSTKFTPANVTNYCLFNLAGHSAGSKELEKHVLTVNANSWLLIDAKNLPTGTISPVDGTSLELRLPAQLNRRRLYDIPGGGYNHSLCVNSPSCWTYRFHARIVHPTSGRFLEVYSNHPVLHVYTGNELPDSERVYFSDLKDHRRGDCENARVESLELMKRKTDVKIRGKGNIPYRRHGGFALSPQNHPNLINVKHFASCMLYPGKIYVHDMTYKFGTLSND